MTTPKQPDDDAQDPLSEMFARLFGGQAGDMDPAAMAKAAGLPDDPNALAQMFRQVQAMMSAPSEGPVNWQLAHDNARQVAAGTATPPSPPRSPGKWTRRSGWPSSGLTRSRPSLHRTDRPGLVPRRMGRRNPAAPGSG